MNLGPWHVSVLIPARDEEQLLPRCLKSVLVACKTLPSTFTSDIVVVSDRSSDRTLQIARSMLSGVGITVKTDAGIAGSARALAAEVALQRSHAAPERCWLANTDADCCVPETWLKDQLTLANAGIEAVTGTVDVDSFAEHHASVADRFRKSYLIHPDGSHPHVHGANIGVRADSYLRAGGWDALATGEDHDLWNRLRRAGASTRSVASLRVVTSGRRVGRAPDGFAGALAAHNYPLLEEAVA